MVAELLDIRNHLGLYPPFDGLSDEQLDEVASQVDVVYYRAGSEILQLNQEIHDLYYVRSGAVEIFRRTGQLYNRLSEGDIFGHAGLLSNRRVRFPARAIEDTLIYLIPESMFDQLCSEDDNFADFVEVEGTRLKATVEQQQKDNDLMITRVRKLVARAPALIKPTETVHQAAKLMQEESVSALLVVSSDVAESSDPPPQLLGILTDRDLCTRVLAAEKSQETPVSEIMTEKPLSIQFDESVYEAMLIMLRNNVHHLPVTYRRQPIGLLSLADIIRYETNSSLFLVSNIFNQPNAKGLAKLSREVRQTFVRTVKEGADFRMVGNALSTIGRSFTRRLLELAEEELGPPPVPYCFIALGSMARNEQTIITDQDNALVLDDQFNPELHDGYFQELARRVSDGLAECGYSYCKGEIMATNPRWRQPLHVWKKTFGDWIATPNPEKLLHSSIFFDLDSVYGQEEYAETLQDLIAEQAAQSPRFLAAMARNALNRTPPLGLFRTFVLEEDGRHKDTINLKRRGTAPLTDLIRVHALACASRAQNSFDRLEDINQTKLLPEGVSERLGHALEFIAMVRINHQVHDIEADREPGNSVRPGNVSASDRHHLKDAFQVLSNAQKFLGFRYPMPAFKVRTH